MAEELPEAVGSRERGIWMSVLAKADPSEVAEAWRRIEPPAYAALRPPESGLVLVRARMGGLATPSTSGK